jgi:hypothetical protein
VDWIHINGQPERYARIFKQHEAVSDDEYAPGTKVRHVKSKPERSKKAKVLARRMDEQMRTNRTYPIFLEKTLFPALPKKLPIDYYSPAWFNMQTDKIKMTIALPFIVFPPDDSHILTTPPHPDELLSTTELNNRYLKKVMSAYVWPTGEKSDAAEVDDFDVQIGMISDSD